MIDGDQIDVIDIKRDPIPETPNSNITTRRTTQLSVQEAQKRNRSAINKALTIALIAGLSVGGALGFMAPKAIEDIKKTSEIANMADQVRIIYVTPYEDRGNIHVKEIAKKISESGDIDLVIYFLRMRCNINTLNAIIKELTGCENLEEYVTMQQKCPNIEAWLKKNENKVLGIEPKSKVPINFAEKYEYIDFDAIDKMINPPQEDSSRFSDDYLNEIIRESQAEANKTAEEVDKGGTKK